MAELDALGVPRLEKTRAALWRVLAHHWRTTAQAPASMSTDALASTIIDLLRRRAG
jgi:hypothetical protein